MSLRRVAVHYDVISPYSWIGFEQIHRHHRLWNDRSIRLELKPTFLARVMKESGNRPPGVITNKMFYMIYDLDRLRNFTKSKRKSGSPEFEHVSVQSRLKG